jgi:hypothetical protein
LGRLFFTSSDIYRFAVEGAKIRHAREVGRIFFGWLTASAAVKLRH